eukprot:scaffold119202_cov21-Tisochrysis_lutea.AAC.1
MDCPLLTVLKNVQGCLEPCNTNESCRDFRFAVYCCTMVCSIALVPQTLLSRSATVLGCQACSFPRA